jgi:hypothetical protein
MQRPIESYYFAFSRVLHIGHIVRANKKQWFCVSFVELMILMRLYVLIDAGQLVKPNAYQKLICSQFVNVSTLILFKCIISCFYFENFAHSMFESGNNINFVIIYINVVNSCEMWFFCITYISYIKHKYSRFSISYAGFTWIISH